MAPLIRNLADGSGDAVPDIFPKLGELTLLFGRRGKLLPPLSFSHLKFGVLSEITYLKRKFRNPSS